MRKLFLLLFLLIQTASFAQNSKKVTIEFNNITRMDAIEKIEKTTGYTFYFDRRWFDGDQELISGNYNNTELETLLNAIFENTELNFFIDNDKIILTSNRVIHRLPDNFLSPQAQTPDEVITEPVFRQQHDSVNLSVPKQSTTIALIGKEGKADKKMYALSGFIINAKTGEKLSNVNVRIRKENISTVTDENGFFTMMVPPGLNNIETESVNHEKFSRKMMVYSDGKLDISITEKINVLDEVIVRANKGQNVRATISGVTTIDTETIKTIPLILGERDVLRVATSIPGVKTAGEGSAGFNVRGGKEDQNLILLDNALLYNPAHFFGFFSALNPFTTKKVDIYKGSIPAEFGGRLSSVFDITTKNGNYEKLAGEGGIGPVTSNLSISTPIVKGKSSILFGARATYSDWILKALDEESLKNSQASFYDGIIKYSHRFDEKNTVESTAYFSHDAFSISSDSLYKYTNRAFSAEWAHKFNEKHRGALVITNSEYKFNIDYSSGGNDAFDFGYKLSETQVMFKMNYTLNQKHKLNYGASGKFYGVSPGYLDPKSSESLLVPINIEKDKGLESAVFVADSFKISEKLQLDFGLRYSSFLALGESTQRVYENGVPINDATVVDVKTFGKNEVIKSYGGLEPRIAARYFIAKDFSVKAGYDKTYQYIHLLSSNTTQSPTDMWKLSDLNIEPQQSEQYSVGFYKNFDDDIWEFSVESYFKKSKNILDYKVAAELLLKDNIETELLQGEGKAYGVEFLLKKTIGKLNGWLGYTYSRTFIKLDSQFNEERVNNGDYFPANFDKPHDVSAVLNYKLTKRYSLSANFIYQTGRPITYPIGTYIFNGAEYTLYSDRNEFRIPDYFRLDLGVNIEGNHKIKKLAHSFWNISVYNVLGRNNPYSIYFVTENGEIKAYKTSIFAIPVPTITYNFKF